VRPFPAPRGKNYAQLALRPLSLVVLLSCWVLWGCQKEEQPVGPQEVLKQFIVAMRNVHGEPAAGERVVELLWAPARKNLEERARRASALSGRDLSPGELIVPSWFALHLSPDDLSVRLDGDWAEVTVTDSSGNSVQTRCKKEEDGWKVALELPPLAPIRVREEGDGP
jgi:hypothetical protein